MKTSFLVAVFTIATSQHLNRDSMRVVIFDSGYSIKKGHCFVDYSSSEMHFFSWVTINHDTAESAVTAGANAVSLLCAEKNMVCKPKAIACNL